MTDTTRRKLLASTATVSVAGLAGCFSDDDPTEISLAEESDCFDAVSIKDGPPLFGSEMSITVEVAEGCDPEYLILIGDGSQLDVVTVATAASIQPIEFEWESETSLELVAATGGRKEGGMHLDGTVLEHVELEVKT